jgi:hypothetical protein
MTRLRRGIQGTVLGRERQYDPHLLVWRVMIPAGTQARPTCLTCRSARRRTSRPCGELDRVDCVMQRPERGPGSGPELLWSVCTYYARNRRTQQFWATASMWISFLSLIASLSVVGSRSDLAPFRLGYERKPDVGLLASLGWRLVDRGVGNFGPRYGRLTKVLRCVRLGIRVRG